MSQNQTRTQAENVSERRTVTPLVDVFENEKEVLLLADLPGVVKDALEIQVDADTLTINAKRPEEPGHGSLLGVEYRVFDFRRTFTLPAGIDREKIEASLENGVLRLHLPKLAALQPRRIAVKSS
jgi:HSP20 family protein